MMDYEKRITAKETEESKVAKAAKAFIENLAPTCYDGMPLYNREQVKTAFMAGRRGLINEIYRAIPLDTLTIDGAFNLLKEFIYSIPKGWSIEQAIEHLKQIDNKED